MKILFRSFELDTANIIIGHYIEEQGYWMNNSVPDYEKPTTRHYIQDEDCIKHEIAPEYLSVNMEDMIDSEGVKIFASLSEDGKGGSSVIVNNDSPIESSTFIVLNKGNFCFYNGTEHPLPIINMSAFHNFKVTGIQQ